MSDASTARMIEMYMEEATAPMFLSGFFKSPPRNFHSSEKVEIDIERDDEDIAITVVDLKGGTRENESTLYTNKAFTPPVFDESGTISAYDLIKRRPGVDPFQDPNFAANAMTESFSIFRKLERKIRRSIELMSSQVLQTGAVTLTDSAGAELYTLDFGMKASHLATSTVAWAGASDPLQDLADLAQLVRRDGKALPNKLIMGQTALVQFLAHSDVQARLDNRRMELGRVAPVSRGQGATYHGSVWIGQYSFEMWGYDGFYRSPTTGLHVPYVADTNVIMMGDQSRLDLTYGAIPMVRRPEAGPLSFLPPRMSDGDAGLDLTTNAWITPDGKSLKVSAGTRPLTIPTAIDTFAVLDVSGP